MHAPGEAEVLGLRCAVHLSVYLGGVVTAFPREAEAVHVELMLRGDDVL